MLSDSQLLAFNRQGLIPGPRETAEDFAKRATYCTQLKENISQELQMTLGEETSFSPDLLQPGMAIAKEFYDIDPKWIPVFFSNYQLAFWHGGCAWIFQVSDEHPLGALLQLRQKFRQSDSYLGIYHRDELTAHEVAHVGRMAFEEAKFEELFAYRTSPHRFRRWFGPIIQSSVESMLLLILLGIIFFIDLSLIALEQPAAYAAAMWLKLLPLGALGSGLARLWNRQHTLNLCLAALKKFLGSEQAALAVAYRLTDSEIKAFAGMSPQAIQAYAQQQKTHSLRWRMITLAYA